MSEKIKDDPIKKHHKKMVEKHYKKHFRKKKNEKGWGVDKIYYPNGQVMFERSFKDSPFFDRTEKWYYENGQLKKEETFKDGELIESKEY